MKPINFFLIIFFLGGLITLIFISPNFKTEVLDIKVKSKENISQRYGEHIRNKYLIYTDKEVFENTDSFLYLKFNSSDFHLKLEDGKTYKVKVSGYRVPFLSWYRNIVEIY